MKFSPEALFNCTAKSYLIGEVCPGREILRRREHSGCCSETLLLGEERNPIARDVRCRADSTETNANVNTPFVKRAYKSNEILHPALVETGVSK